MNIGKVYLIPAALQNDEAAWRALPSYVLDATKNCSVFFVESKKSTRRFFKHLWKEMIIENYEWYEINKAEETLKQIFIQHLQQGKNIGIVSEAGCPGIADPGQILIEAAHEMNAIVRPLVGPSSILLALMASGMNGQCFQFAGYLPIESAARKKKIRSLEDDSQKRNCTQIFIETPYRNNQLIKDVISTCKPNTRFCIGVDITALTESIQTKTVAEWKTRDIDIHKRPAIFLLYAH